MARGETQAVFEALEARILYSADLAPVAALDSALHDTERDDAQEQRIELVFIDASLDDVDTLIDDFARQADDGRAIEVILLDPTKDGVTQISDALAGRENIGAIHLITHGEAGRIALGNTTLETHNLFARSAEVAEWGRALTADADVLIYGCDVAGSEAGVQLVRDLALLTGADVAASDDLTGDAAQGGDWVLEQVVGEVSAPLSVTEYGAAQWRGVLATYTVNSTADTDTSNIGTLRWAIDQANNNGEEDTIRFNIAGAGVHTINVASALPTISAKLTIEGLSQGGNGYGGTPLVRIDGAATGFSGISIGSGGSGSTIQGLMITGFTADGINVASGANNVTMSDNWIGTAGTGTSGHGNSGVGNSDDGIDIAGSNATIVRNVITNNNNEGITIVGSGVTAHVIQGNYIGLDPDGATGGGNYDVGIAIISGSGNIIGGTLAAQRNAISMNHEGMEINTSDNVVQGNYIGTDTSGTLNRGNRLGDGVQIQGSSTNNQVGGVAADVGNLIAYNAGRGVAVVNGNGHSVLGNSIYSNSQLGIDLASNGVTNNDPTGNMDSDTGANGLQNFPILTSAITTGSQVTIAGTLNSNASGYYRVEFFANIAADASGYGEGRRYLGFENVTTNVSGNFTFSKTLTANVAAGELVTATATKSVFGYASYSDTSEFSAATASTNTVPVAVDDSYNVAEDSTLVVSASPSTPSHLWGFNEGSGQTTADTGLSPLTGTLGSSAGADASDPTWTTGYVGNAGLSFDGAGDYLATTSTELKTANNFTLSAWLQTNTTTGAHHILWQGYAGGNGYGNGGSSTAATSEMSLSVGGYTAEFDNKIVFFLGYDVPANGGNPIYIVSDSNFLDTGGWHQVTVTVSDAGGGLLNAALYVDGKLEGSDSGNQNDRSVWEPMRIGAAGDGSRAFDGKIDEVRLYETALSAAQAKTLAQAGVLENDTDANNDVLNAVLVSGPSNGSLSLVNDGSFVYTPNANFSGPDSFTYRANDGNADSNIATATITVTAVADTPSVTPATTDEDTQNTSGLVISRNVAGDAEVTHFKITGITNGTLYQNNGTTQINNGDFITFDQGNAGLKFLPTANFNGSGSFTVQASTSNVDAGLGGSTVIATITVNAVDDAPTDLSSGIELNTDGGNDAYLYSETGGVIIGGLGQITVEVVFSLDAPSTREIGLIGYATTSFDDELQIVLRPDGRLALEVQNAPAITTDSITELYDGQQHHIAASWDATNGDVLLYVDGKLVQASSGIAQGVWLNTGGTLVLGQDQDSVGDNFESDQAFHGTYYDVRIWNEVRSEAEISLNYQNKFDSSNLPTGLIANWQMNGFNSSNEVVDVVSGNNLTTGHATGIGFTASTPVDDLHISEHAMAGTSVGYVVPHDPDVYNDVVSDGLFLDAGIPLTYRFYSAPATLGAWQVVQNSVDLLGDSYGRTPLGGLGVDLNGTSPGAIEQTLTTVIGREYQVTFAFSGNWSSDEPIKDLRVSAGGTSIDFSVTKPAGWSETNMLWGHRAFTFVADSTSTTLRFKSLDGINNSGPVIGDVQAIEIPAAVEIILTNDPTLTYDAATGKFYRHVDSIVDFNVALDAATSDELNGVSGQLVTIRSAYENELIHQFVVDSGNQIWLGASDAGTEGEWNWFDGATESSEKFWSGGAFGAGVVGEYASAMSLSDGATEDYLQMTGDGSWEDSGDSYAYVVEWDASEILSNFTFTLTNDSGGRFAIDSSTGEITVADGSLLDYESATSHNVDVRVTDAAGNSYVETMTIAVDNRSDINQTVPGPQSVNEDTALTFSSGNSNAVTVSDSLVATDTHMQVALAVNDGYLTLSQLTGITIVEGAQNSDSITFNGIESDINTALEGMAFTPDADFNGGVTLNMTTAFTADLVGNYTFDDATANDSSAGATQNGTFTGNATTVTDGTRGEVLSLDGVGDAVTISGRFGDPQNVTIAAWVNLNSVGTNGADVISLGDSVSLRLDSSYSNWGVVGSFKDSTDWTQVPSSEYLVGDGWHHVAFSVDSTNDVQSLYIDGVLVAQANSTEAVFYDRGANTTIGKHGNGSTAYDFDGKIDDARVYTRALSADEIANLLNDNPSKSSSIAITVNPVNDAPTFLAGDGVVTTDVIFDDDGADIVMQPDGKILVAGTAASPNRFLVARYLSDGSLDTSFGGGDGLYTLSAGVQQSGSSLTLQADGKILVAGYSYPGNADFALLRLNADGTTDTSFGSGGNGTVTTAINGSEEAYSVTLQADGKILLAGVSNSDFAVVRYNTDGTLDTSFNSTGIVTTDLGGPAYAAAYTLLVQPDGKIVLAGTGGNYDLAIVRYNSDGSLDTSFGSGGIVLQNATGGLEALNGLVIDTDGKLVAAGYSGNDFVLVRYNSNGTLDTSFNGTGTVFTSLGAGADRAADVALQSDGKIVAVGRTHNGSDFDFAVVRYNTDGTLDTTFGGSGIVTTAIGASDDEGLAVTIDANGKIFVSGRTYNGSDDDIALVSYNADGSPDTRFHLANTLDGNPTFIEGGAAVVLDANVSIFDAELSAANDFDGATLTLARNGGANADDQLVFDGIDVTVSGTNVSVGGIQVGTYSFTGGQLTVTFDSNATQARVNTLMQNVLYSNASDTPPAAAQIDWTFNDGNTASAQGSGGALTATGSTTVDITAVNDAPTLTATALNPAFTEAAGLGTQAAAVNVFGGSVASTVETGQSITALTFTVSGLLDGANEVIVVDGTTITLGASSSGSTTTNFLTYGATVSGGTATIVLSGGSLSAAATQALVNGITYQNTRTDTPSAGNRVFTLMQIKDSGGTANSGADTTTLSIGSTVTVTAVNDSPTLTAMAGAVATVNEDTQAAITFANLAAQANDADVDGTVTGFVVKVVSSGSLKIGTSEGSATDWVLGVNDTIDATRLAYWTGALDADGTLNAFTVLAKDDGGLESLTAPVQVQVSVTAVNDAPVVDLDADNSSGAAGGNYVTTFTEKGGPVNIADFIDASLYDADMEDLVSLTITLVNPLDGVNEFLSADTTGTSIIASYDSGTGVLSLTGTDSVAHYEQVLRSVTYNNASEDPDPTARGITIVANDGTDDSSAVTWHPAAAGLVGYWSLNEGSGNQVSDLSGNGNDGTLTNMDPATDWVAGQTGHALQFDGINDYVEIPYSSELKLDGDFTIALWSKPDSVNVATHRVMEYGKTQWQTDGWLINQYGDDLYWYHQSSGPTSGATNVFTAGEWTHIAITRSGDTFTLYVDGVQRDQDVKTGFITGNHSLYLGSDAGTQQYAGALDDVRIYNGALDAGEIQAVLQDRAAVATINISTVNDAPTLTATALNPAFTEAAGLGTQAAAVNVFGASVASTVEAGQSIAELTFTVSGLLDGANEVIVVDGRTITLAASSSGTTTTNSLTYGATVSGGTATIVLSGGSMNTAATQALVDGITYQNTRTDTPSAGNRVFTLAQIKDSGGGADTTTLAIGSTVAVVAVNDAPVITSNGGGASAAINVAERTTTVTTVTSSDVDGGTAVYSIIPGDDGARFDIESGTGLLTFVTAPDFENPGDVGGDNVYNLTIQVSDGVGGTVTQAIAVTVIDVADGIRVVPSVAALGTETRVNTTTTGNQSSNLVVMQAVASDANGNYVVVWDGHLPGQKDVYAQRFSADGTALGGEFQVNTFTTSNQLMANVAMDAAGNFVIVWQSQNQDGDGRGIYAQRYDAAGAAQGTEFRVNSTTAGDQTSPVIAMASSGAFVIAWNSDDGSNTGIYAQRYSASGVAQGNEFGVNTFKGGAQNLPSVGMDAVGNFVITWTSANAQDGSGTGIFGQRFAAGGAVQGAEFLVNTTTGLSQTYADVAMLADGRFVVAWDSANADGSKEVYLQRYAADGNRVGAETRVNATTVSSAQAPYASVSADASGNIVVVWSSAADGDGSGVVGRRLDWSGTPLGGEFQINTTTAGGQSPGEVVAQPEGGFVVVWTGNGAGDPDGVFMQRYGLSTTEAGGTATFQVVLEAAPTADVVIPVSVPDATEGTVSMASLTFTSGNWNVAQTITVTGLQDYSNDGDQVYKVVFGAATSADSNFNTLNPADLSVTNFEVANMAPVNVVPGAQTVDEDTAKVFSSGNGNSISISDVDAGTNAVQVALSVTNGTLTLAAGFSGLSFVAGDGTADAGMTFTGTIANINTALDGLRFNPAANFSGAALLTISTNDLGNSGTGGPRTDSDTVAITVVAVNDAPLAVNDANGGNEDTVITGNVLTNDTDAEGDPLTAVLVNGPANGTLTLSTNGTFSYTANANWHGSDSFTYRANDGALDSNVATVTITVNPVNDAPTGSVTITGTTTEDQTLSADTSGIADADGLGTFAYQWQRSTDGGASWNNVGANAATYTLGDADVGNVLRVSASYTDGHGTDESLTSAQTAAIVGVNDAPTVANPITNQAAVEDAPYSFTFADNTFADADTGDALTYTTSGVPTWLSFDAITRTFSGTPENADVGTSTITLRATDGSGAFVEDQFDLTVANTNDSPMITSAAQVAGQHGVRAVTTVSASDVDAGDVLTYLIAGGADAGQFVIDAATGALRFVSIPNFALPADADHNNIYEVVVRATDREGASDAQAMSVSITLDVAVLPTDPGPDRAPEPELAVEAPARQTPGEAVVTATEPDAPSGGPIGTSLDANLDDILGEPLPVFDAPQIDPGAGGYEVTIGDVRFTDYAPNNTELLRLLFAPDEVQIGSVRPNLPDRQVELPQEVLEQIAESGEQMKFVFEQVGVSGVALTVGVVWWATRVGGLVASMMVTLPAWRSIDPLPVLRDVVAPEIGDADADADEDTPADDAETEGEKIWEGAV